MMWHAWFRPRRWERTLDSELRFHLQQQIEDNISAGMSPGEARRRAMLEFGAIELAKEECRDQRPWNWLADALSDTRYAVRTLARSPGFAAVAVLTLAMGIGANTAVFTLFHHVLLKALPVTDPEELVELGCVNGNEPDKTGCRASYPAFQMFRQGNQVLSGLFAFAPVGELNVFHSRGTELARGLLATGDMYSVLGVSPAIGRLLNSADDAPSASPAAVLSYSYWQHRFGGDPRIVGQAVRVNTLSVVVVGVTPSRFRGITLGEPPEITIAMGSGAPLFHGRNSLVNGGNQWLRMIGRRREGASLSQIQAALQPVFRRSVEQLLSSVPAGMAPRARAYFDRVHFRVAPAAAGGVSEFRRNLDRPLRVLMAVVGIVLLMACVNLASLLLSRTAARRREFGVRLAIGAGSWRLIRQHLTETILLSTAGAALGILVARLSGPVLLRMASGEIGLQAVDLSPDLPVLFFTSAVALITGVLLGIGPILHIRNADPQLAIRDGGDKRTASRLSRWLIPAQVALATVVLIGTGLLLRSFDNLAHIDLGFRRENRVMFTVSPQLAGYDTIRTRSYFHELTRRLEALPEVLSATVSSEVMGGLGSMTMVEVPGFGSSVPMDRAVGRNHVGPRFIETNGLRLLLGRDFSPVDGVDGRRVAVINESFARRFFGSPNVIDRRFSFTGDTGPPYVVIGLVADALDRGPKTSAQPVVYTPYDQQSFGRGVMTVRVRDAGDRMMNSVRSVIRGLDPGIPIQGLRTLDSQIDETLRRERLLAVLGSFFGGLVLLLVSIGIYGLIAGMVSRRTNEIGIRMALGARRASVLRLFLGEGMALVSFGLIAGAVAGGVLTRFLQSQLYGVTSDDPVTFAVAMSVLLASALAAALFPALRASHTEPVLALRHD